MDLGLNQKKVLITGSSKGIGLGIAKNFLLEGAKVFLTARNQVLLNSSRDLLVKEFGIENVHSAKCDFTVPEEIYSLKNQIEEEWGSLDIVVSNIGDGQSTSDPIPIEEAWIKSWNINFNTALYTSRIFLPFLEKSNGNILFISSIAGLESIGAPTDYSTAKAALVALSKNMSNKLGGLVRVNVLAPGNILFDGGAWDKKIKTNSSEIFNNINQVVPMGRFGNVQEVADTAVFICSERSSFTTGSVVVVDGGQTINF
jgi:3-oxoacyl-[acyl-carrier protein] reductase